jgi:hypothetical protein
MDRIIVLIPLVVGSSAIACTIVIHAATLVATLWLVRHERTFGRVGVTFWIDLRIVITVILFTLMAHLVGMGVWAALLVLIGEFQYLGVALYHSAMNYTSLGYGDIVMSPAWRMLGPVEATNGLLMFGVSTAMIFTVIQRLVQTRFPDLRS